MSVPPKIRGMIVDDGVVMRRLLTEVLQRDQRIHVVGTAPNGRLALQKISQINPDFVTLDIEMPELDGIATLREIRAIYPKLPVIMLSSLTRKGATATLDALAAGANDYVAKPSDVSDLADSIARLEIDLLPKIIALCARSTPIPEVKPISTRPKEYQVSSRNIDLICIATSTGGPNALAEVFKGFTRALPVPAAIVQHMPPMFTQSLAERLNTLSPMMKCKEAKEGEVLEPGSAYIAPGGLHLSLSRNLLGNFVASLLETPPENSCRPAADVLFRSAAATGANLLGVVMTGMGQDGLRGCELIKERHGQVVIQNQETSVVWGMPGAVAQAGLADSTLPLYEIAGEITRRTFSVRSHAA